jgi:hypothetical protein
LLKGERDKRIGPACSAQQAQSMPISFDKKANTNGQTDRQKDGARVTIFCMTLLGFRPDTYEAFFFLRGIFQKLLRR